MLSPLLAILLLVSPLLTLGILDLCASPSEPVTVTYADCRRFHRSVVLYTADNRQWLLPHHLRAEFYKDVRDGRVVPGDRLTITWYPRVFQNAVATLSSRDKVYADLDAWEAMRRKDAHAGFILSAVLLAAGLAFCVLLRHSMRREFDEIRRLKQKYRARLAEGKQEAVP